MTGARPAAATEPLVADLVRVRALEAPVDTEVPMSFSSLRSRQMCIVEVHADGLTGVGESWVNYPPWAARERLATIGEGVAALLLGSDVGDPVSVHQRLARALVPLGRQWGAPGPIWQAISGVDMALWDLAGHRAGRSAAALWTDGSWANGDRRAAIPAYGSGVGPTEVRELSERAVATGLTAVKLKVGFGRERDESTVAVTREVCGPDMRLFADANQAWRLTDAAEMTRLLADYGVEWLEEPLAGNDLGELEKLSEDTGMPLATGENVYGFDEFARHMASPAIGQIQPDVAKTGGLTTACQVAHLAAQTGTRVSPHWYGGVLGVAASLQLGAGFETVDWIELDLRDNPLRTGLATEPLTLDGGRLRVPPGPGLGTRLDPAAVRHFQVHQEERRLS